MANRFPRAVASAASSFLRTGSGQMEGWTKPSAGVTETVQPPRQCGWGWLIICAVPDGLIELPPWGCFSCFLSLRSGALYARPGARGSRSRGQPAAEASSSSDLWHLPKPRGATSVPRNSRAEGKRARPPLPGYSVFSLFLETGSPLLASSAPDPELSVPAPPGRPRTSPPRPQLYAQHRPAPAAARPEPRSAI